MLNPVSGNSLQNDNVRNQREHFVLLLANAQSQRNDSNVPRGLDQVLRTY